jgi:hypothetical protein
MTAPDVVEAAVTADGDTRRCGGRRASWMEAPRHGGVRSRTTWTLRLEDDGKEDRANAAEELGDEDDGLALRLGAIDPLQRARGESAQARARDVAEASSACGARRVGKRRVG